MSLNVPSVHVRREMFFINLMNSFIVELHVCKMQ